MDLLEIKNLSLFKEGRPILNNLSMDIWEGHVHAIIGPNGAGKSTLANTIMGLSDTAILKAMYFSRANRLRHSPWMNAREKASLSSFRSRRGSKAWA